MQHIKFPHLTLFKTVLNYSSKYIWPTMKFLNCLLILVLYLKFKPADGGTTDICNYKTCGECISSVDYCVWCSEDGITERCRPWSYLNSTETWCKDEFIENPKLEVNYNNVTFSSSVQFIPTIMTIRARPGNSIPIEMFYKPAKDYPLDVYYLMDTSFTMKKHIDVLQKQANDIHSKLTELTNNVFLGAGSFIEKQAFPYYDKHRLQVSHAFKNLVSLTNNVEQFKEAVNIIKFGSNQDDPEAGLDALMQVMTCKNELGWRNDSRKIIVLCTDNLYHSAGDGKMIGIIKPNDMQCHYKDGVYATETELDYPSVSQINKIATENGFIIIFAVVKTFENVYKALASQITGASYSELSNDSNVIKIIIDNYKDQIKKVQLSANFPKFVKLSLIPDCSVNGNDSCEVSLHKPIADIKGTLTIISCPEQPLNKLEIGPVGLLQDKLTIQLDVNCQCKCENENATTSPKCHDAGYYQCGICKCMEFRYGNDCRCNGTSTDTSDSEKCKIKDMTKECNGRGKCRCGKCEDCQSGFSGEFCEFNDNACPSINRKLCADNGLCRLGRCHCKGGWRGDDCNCPISDDTCIAPRSTNVCSGNGDCVCGSCNCKKSEKNETYSGLYCDICEECAEKRCKELEGYVYCNYQNNKTICDEQFNTTDIQVLFVNKTEINGPRWYSANWCRKELDDGSFIAFKYDYHDSKLILIIQKEKELPPKANIWVAVGSAIGAVLLIGLLTLIVWKILIDIYDTREYNKFATESAAAGYEILDNPIFKKPEVNYKNPAYSRNCSEEFDK